jgi:hypothetical protein
MRGTWVAAAGVVLGCGQAPAPEPAAPPAAAASAAPTAATADAAPAAALTVQAGPLRVLAFGARDGQGNDVLRVQRLEVYSDAAGQAPIQVLAGLSTETPSSPEAPGLETPDMNFDGHPDLRLIEFRSAGPNTPWLNWLYDPTQARFVASQALDALPSAEFDAATREVRSPWRDGATRSGVDVHVWQAGTLTPLRRELRQVGPDGRETLSHQRWVDGAWVTVERL